MFQKSMGSCKGPVFVYNFRKNPQGINNIIVIDSVTNLFDRLSLYAKRPLIFFIVLSVNNWFLISKTTVMRIILFLSLLLPAIVNAQFNRSATELAKENIREYLTGKIFKDHPYQSISYSELKRCGEKNPEIIWSIKHRFEIAETEIEADKKISVHKPYQFIFYLDKKMKVLRAENFYSD